MAGKLVELLAVRRGHFRLESGHHGDLWLDLDALFLRPDRLRPYVLQLADLLSAFDAEVICGPSTGGAFVAYAAACAFERSFCYAERVPAPASEGLYQTSYRIPAALRQAVGGRRVAIVDDVINAGSATRATFAALDACGAQPVAIGALLVLGEAAAEFAARRGLALVTVERLGNNLWPPADCPLCAAGKAIDPLPS